MDWSEQIAFYFKGISEQIANSNTNQTEFDKLNKEKTDLQKKVKSHSLTVDRLYKETQMLYRKIRNMKRKKNTQKKLSIYVVRRTDDVGHEELESAIIVTTSKAKAKLLFASNYSYISAAYLSCEKIGKAKKQLEEGIFLQSYCP